MIAQRDVPRGVGLAKAILRYAEARRLEWRHYAFARAASDSSMRFESRTLSRSMAACLFAALLAFGGPVIGSVGSSVAKEHKKPAESEQHAPLKVELLETLRGSVAWNSNPDLR